MKFLYSHKLVVIGLILFFSVTSCGKKDNPSGPNNGTNTNPTNVDAPTIESIQPNKGFAGDTITVTGKNFSSVITENSIKFGSAEAAVISATNTQIKLKLPTGGVTGAITVRVKNSEYVSGLNFTYLSPITVTSFSPSESAVGQPVTITGTNFSTVTAENAVFFNGTAAIVKSATTTKLIVTVPQGATSGVIKVTTFNRTASIDNFKVLILPNTLDWTEVNTQVTMNDMVSTAEVGSAVLLMSNNNGYMDPPRFFKLQNEVFTEITNTLPFKGMGVYCIKGINNNFYALTDQGIYKSSDASAWNKLVPDKTSTSLRFSGVLTSGNTLLFLTGSKAYITSDEGTTWTTQTSLFDGLGSQNQDYFWFNTEPVNGYYYSVSTLSNAAPLISSTDGLTWAKSSSPTGAVYFQNGFRDIIAGAGNNLFCIFSPYSINDVYNSQRLWKSTDRGDTWVKVSDQTAYAITVSGGYITYGYDRLNLSIDNGDSFSPYLIPAGYTIGGIKKFGSYIYIFCKGASNTHKIFKAKI